MKATRIGRYSSPEARAAEVSLVRATGGQVFKSPDGRLWAVCPDNVPFGSSARIFYNFQVPVEWEEQIDADG